MASAVKCLICWRNAENSCKFEQKSKLQTNDDMADCIRREAMDNIRNVETAAKLNRINLQTHTRARARMHVHNTHRLHHQGVKKEKKKKKQK